MHSSRGVRDLYKGGGMSSLLRFGPVPTLDWLQLRAGSNPLSVTPGPLPLLGLPLEARVLQPGVEAEVLRLSFRLSLAGLVIGTGEIGPAQVGASDQPLSALVALVREAMPLLLSPPAGRISLTLRLTGLLRFRHHLEPARQPDLPDRDIWHLVPVSEQVLHELDLSVARSDWYDQVVQPLGLGSQLLIALRLPDAEQTPEWAAVLARLADAERALTSGEAAAAFGQCRGAVDALPGAKKHIFDAIGPGPDRDAIDALTLAVGTYLHSGRHVVPETGGVLAGEFPVGIEDATFAYNLVRLLLSRIAGLVLPSPGTF